MRSELRPCVTCRRAPEQRVRFRRLLVSMAVGATLLALLAGCGGSSNSPSTTPVSTTRSQTHTSPPNTTASREKVPDLDLRVSIPGLQQATSEQTISSRYTCDGADLSPPISWGRVPAHTVEIDLFLVNVEHEMEYAQWAVSGLSPLLRGLPAGRLPKGSILGRNRYGQLGYRLCPPKGVTADYALLYFPLPRRLAARPGFDPQALALRAAHTAPTEGQLFFVYKRA
jgi:phosphatidylethanolamine-binding protein (PEBP) family uncharacterized protein